MMAYPTNTVTQVSPNKLIAIIQFMQRLHKHKGPLFVYKKNKFIDGYNNQEQGSLNKENNLKKQSKAKTVDYFYTINPCLDFKPLVLSFGFPVYLDTALIRYHPYLHLLERCRILFNGLWPKLELCNLSGALTNDDAANTIAICEWLRAQMKYPPLAAQVRAFEQSTLKQAKEVNAYFKGFFREDMLFYWYSMVIGFAGEITTEEGLIRKLTEITVFRTKLLSQLKNHDLITEKHTRYSWKVIVIGNQLSLHLQVLHRQLHQVSEGVDNAINGTVENKNNKNEQFIKQIKQSAETVKIVISPEPSINSFHTKDTKEAKRAGFNQQLIYYFDLDFWFPYYQIACKHPKKMLFGKGNDKTEKHS